MKTWQKMGLAVLAVVLIAGVRLYFVFKARQDPGVAVRKAEADAKPANKDDVVDMRLLYFANFEDAKQLEGKPVWIKAGYSLPYYPFVDGKVVFSKRAGMLPAAEKLSVTKLEKAAAPAKEDDRVEHGTKQYFAIFTMDGTLGKTGDGKPGVFAAPIGYVQGQDEKFYADQLFYYDDPKTIYDYWPQRVWDGVTAHTPTVGMTENQARMALGIILQSDSQSIGNRTVTYDLDGKKWTVTFANNAATAVKAG